MKPVKRLYRYCLNRKLEKFDFGGPCRTKEIVRSTAEGNLWKIVPILSDYGTVYGWDTLRAARQEEIGNTLKSLSELTEHLTKLRGTK